MAQELLAEFARCLGLPASALPPVVYKRVQLWGAALPQNSPRVPCIWDPSARAGVCGDWVLEGGSMQVGGRAGVCRRPAALAHVPAGRHACPLACLASKSKARSTGWSGQLPTPVPCLWLQAAALSGLAMAESIADMRGKASGAPVGLSEPAKPISGTAIGQFPGAELGVEEAAKPAAPRAKPAAAARQPARAR